MKQIEIGACVPGSDTKTWLAPLVEAGFECVALNFHMSLGGTDLHALAEQVMPYLREKGVRVATIGYYCNPIENTEQRKTLESVIDAAPLFGAPMVSTFAGAYEGEPVEKAIPKFGEVFRELGKRAADNGLKIAIENCPMDGTWQRATCNIAFHPKAWEMMFEAVPEQNVGLEWEPGHQSIQLIDPVSQLREWIGTGRILHMHGKDCTTDWTLCAGTAFWEPCRLPSSAHPASVTPTGARFSPFSAREAMNPTSASRDSTIPCTAENWK